MTLKRYITEMGMGVDVHGGDYTKAAKRAVSDAIRHSSLNFFPHIDKSRDDMQITLKLGVADPQAVDLAAVAAEFPYGKVTVEPEQGGLDVMAENGQDRMVLVNAVVLVCFDE
ncbi:MAG: Lin0512 family protein [Pseudomonadota bacterium]